MNRGPRKTKLVFSKPRLDRRAEVRTALIYAVIAGMTGLLLAGLSLADAGPDDSIRAIVSFALGLIAACALASSLTFLIFLRHRLLLISLGAAICAVGGIWLGLVPVESMAKIIFATAAGLWIALMLTSIGQVVLISALIIFVDFYSVFFGPTKKMAESGGPWIEYLTISLPAFGESAVSRLGISDIVFFSLFVGSALTFRLRRTVSALAMTMSFIVTMIIGVRLNIGVPALPLLSIFFLLSNADLLYKRLVHGSGGNGHPGGQAGEDRR